MVEIIPRTSEDQWLEARRSRVTATDIGRLANGGPASWAAVKAEKHGARGFTGNRYTEWGHEREPVIVAHLTFLYGVEPNDALFVSGDRAATPDGVSEDALAEVKTTVRPWADLDHLRASQPKYYDQVQWAQLVVEREKTWFAFEPHENFIPGDVEHFLIPRDEERIKELIEVEAEFREYLETDEQAGEWDEFMARYVEAEAAAREAQAVVEAMKEELREKLGDRELSAKTAFGSISYSMPKPRSTFDQAAFRKAHADLAEQFTRLVPAKAPTLRITVK